MDPVLLAEVSAGLESKNLEDRRAVICACGHALGKHATARGRTFCNGRKANCKCEEAFGVVKVPNARLFMYKSDEIGSAVAKGVAKTFQSDLGHRIEWVVDLRCLEDGCGSEDRVDFVEVNSGKTHTMRCAGHRS